MERKGLSDMTENYELNTNMRLPKVTVEGKVLRIHDRLLYVKV
jgi:hypothetical protein